MVVAPTDRGRWSMDEFEGTGTVRMHVPHTVLSKVSKCP